MSSLDVNISFAAELPCWRDHLQNDESVPIWFGYRWGEKAMDFIVEEAVQSVST